MRENLAGPEVERRSNRSRASRRLAVDDRRRLRDFGSVPYSRQANGRQTRGFHRGTRALLFLFAAGGTESQAVFEPAARADLPSSCRIVTNISGFLLVLGQPEAPCKVRFSAQNRDNKQSLLEAVQAPGSHSRRKRLLPRISVFNSRLAVNIHLTATELNCQLGFRLSALQRTTRGVRYPSPQGP